ncbi:pyruvate kinase [Paenibacillus antri]|uniref:Pyruvate kinase n=1 Tax=Paenibacillus antri TaxID=2582848 RepID=A0A5R9GAB8_9BACL|nr:PEP/pyruvate-binding domain-containing protein [Paenibacillus antri]TLS52701.1 pyruvate kinase [Paenibacillus antri]
MGFRGKASTGLPGFDQVIDMLRLGDNVVWQVDSTEDYQRLVAPYIEQSLRDERRLVYVRFGKHEPVIGEHPEVETYEIDPTRGFERFTAEVYALIERRGKQAFYVFDSLTELLEQWKSDLMIGNFFKIVCPYLYELDTIAYFALIRSAHTYSTIAGIRETTQLLLDVYRVNGNVYIHPLKVWNRYSPTMFFPHLIRGDEAVSITASTETAELFSAIRRGAERLDYWDVLLQQAQDALQSDAVRQEQVKRTLIAMMLGGDAGRMTELCERYFTLSDLLLVASREIGTGFIGGKSVGMLLARKILDCEGRQRFADCIEPHDSYYIGSDVYYTYIVQNGWWGLRAKQRTEEGYFEYGKELKTKLLQGKFPPNIRERLMQMLEYFGQSPIIVRSSSLLEDNFGNAFAGKYESVFCANQGTPEERYEALEQAIRVVYASSMDEDALQYRLNRGLFDRDEQMAILVQRVSGDHYRDHFFPHVAGVGFSMNLYVWEQGIDMNAGMLRLVFGLGTRAVDRTEGDYTRLVALDDPSRLPPMYAEDERKYSQHDVDVLSLGENRLTTRKADEVLQLDLKTDRGWFATPDYETERRMRELGMHSSPTPQLLHFRRLLRESEFPATMRDMLAQLERVYDYPVDLEFTANFGADGRFKINVLQCRPMQTRGLGGQGAVKLPELGPDAAERLFFAGRGNFMGGNARLPVERVVYVRPEAYAQLTDREKYSIARTIGKLNAQFKGKHALLIGPGRWGTTIPSLGVPLRFSELCHMTALFEVAVPSEGFMPELSYGSHFFQDLVESDIFYGALFVGREDVAFRPDVVLRRPNRLEEWLPEHAGFAHAIHAAETPGMTLYADVVNQKMLCME